MPALARAFLAGTVLVLLADSVLHLALAAVRVSDVAAPWWVNARVVERSAWVVMASLLWLAVRGGMLGDGQAVTWSREAAFRLVGACMIAVPIAWTLATIVVTLVRTALASARDGGLAIFLEPYFYSDLVLRNAPWLLAGAVLLTVSRHLAERR